MHGVVSRKTTYLRIAIVVKNQIDVQILDKINVFVDLPNEADTSPRFIRLQHVCRSYIRCMPFRYRCALRKHNWKLTDFLHFATVQFNAGPSPNTVELDYMNLFKQQVLRKLITDCDFDGPIGRFEQHLSVSEYTLLEGMYVENKTLQLRMKVRH